MMSKLYIIQIHTEIWRAAGRRAPPRPPEAREGERRRALGGVAAAGPLGR